MHEMDSALQYGQRLHALGASAEERCGAVTSDREKAAALLKIREKTTALVASITEKHKLLEVALAESSRSNRQLVADNE